MEINFNRYYSKIIYNNIHIILVAEESIEMKLLTRSVQRTLVLPDVQRHFVNGNKASRTAQLAARIEVLNNWDKRTTTGIKEQQLA